jgi:virulence-associated protein VagC
MAAIETRTFKSDDGVALLLPEELGFVANIAVTIERVGEELRIRPVKVKDPVEDKRRLDRLVAALRAIGPVGEIGPREPIDFPDRPGLY